MRSDGEPLGAVDSGSQSPTDALHLMPTEGAWDHDGVGWFAREHYPKRSQVMTYYANFCGIHYIEVRARARFMRYAPDDPGAGEYDGEYWVECKRDEPGAFPVWRCE